MGLSKKHFKAIAELLHSEQATDSLIQAFVDYFATENPQFMPDRFRCACKGVKWLKEQ